MYVTKWFCHGKRHRLNGPAHNETYINNDNIAIRQLEKLYLKGKLHRIGNPAYYKFFLRDDVEILRLEKWYVRGKLHRKKEPAIVKYNKHNVIISRIWSVWGLTHHEITWVPDIITDSDLE